MIFGKTKLSTKLVLLPLGVALAMALIFVYLVPHLEDRLFEGKRAKVREVVETAVSLVEHYRKESESGALSLEKAQDEAKAAINALRYADDQYFWINDFTPRMIMHPMNPGLIGKDLSGNRDPDGKALFVEMAKVGKERGAGFVEYRWPKPGATEPMPKISYVQTVPGWNWIVGSGIYVDDVLGEINALIFNILSVAGTIFLLAVLAGWLFARSVSKPLRGMASMLDTGAEQISTAAGQVNATSQQLAQGASEQAASLEETSSSLEELASMTKRNADHAQQANTLMDEVETVVGQASQAMQELDAAMVQISSASEETSKIIKTIDEIAFQTNLLALNAAVEAARAGEAGAGFAVVADEVRSLAMRAADAARNTAELIQGTVEKVKSGAELGEKATTAFSKVAASSHRASELVGEIAAASQEQAQGIDQINRATTEMDKVTQQNAAAAEESAAAAEEMNAQAESMRDTVSSLVSLVEGTRSGEPRETKKIPRKTLKRLLPHSPKEEVAEF